ncbi:5581_t:CDS:1, partial [Dentiscutata erythropus]
SNKLKLQKVNIYDQSIFTNIVITGLINNIVECASKSSTKIPSSNSSNRFEFQNNIESKLQKSELTLDSQKFELESYEEPEFQEEFELTLDSQ